MATVEPGEAAELIDEIRTQAAFSMIENDLGWFLEHGVVSSRTSAEIRSEVTRRSVVPAENARRLVTPSGSPTPSSPPIVL